MELLPVSREGTGDFWDIYILAIIQAWEVHLEGVVNTVVLCSDYLLYSHINYINKPLESIQKEAEMSIWRQ